MRITSLQHPLVKHFVSLRKESSYRKQSKSVLLIGEKVIRECFLPIRCLFSLDKTQIQAKTSYLVTEEILQKIGGSEMVAEVDLPEPQNVEDKNFVLILDQIQDPGNLGTLLRASLGLGWEGVIATPGTVDFFNDKALKASQGAIFKLPFSFKTPEEIISWVQRKKISIWVADAGGAPYKNESFIKPLALVLSNEGNGINQWAKEFKMISIPLQNKVESLNVATAGAILLHHMRGL